MGLLARFLELEDISTICITFRKDIVQLIRPPRILSLKFSAGKPLGMPGDINTQKGIIDAGFKLLEKEIKGMTVIDLPFKLKKMSTL
ncbi:MAG: hypothetical protein ISR96_10605 [Nitrospira sp.]|nr:hypothetical protein [bacterium]MBL7049953.1 hypothetical protein [Nitrospira sp.]